MATEVVNSTPLGSSAPSFALTDVLTGQTVSLESIPASKALLIVFLCRHCPYVVHVRPELAKITSEYESKGLKVISISSNDPVKYPDDAPAKLAEMAKDLPFPVLFDETQEVAKAYDAQCTPDFFLFDSDRKLVYRGRLDESTPGNGKPVTGADLRGAIDAILSGTPVSPVQKSSLGCSIKWK